MVAKTSGTHYAIAFANASLALEACLKMLLPKGGTVGVPTFSFTASHQAIRNANCTPIFFDIDHDFKALWGTLPDIYMPVNLFGSHSKNYGSNVVCDSAHALGIKASSLEVYSLHATKLINGFEGGVVVTNNANHAIRLKQLRNFGYEDPNLDPSIDMEGRINENLGGTNAKMSEVHAAMAISNLEQIKKVIKINKNNWDQYNERLSGKVNLFSPGTNSNFSYIVCRHPDRDRIVEKLHEHRVYARKYFQHLGHEVFGVPGDFPNAQRIKKEIFALPQGIDIGYEEIKYICSLID